MATLRATVTLTPLSTPGDFVRKIQLDPTRSVVYIGRASRNESKGLLANKDNAWFDSPIMSRQHAMLSMSSLPKRIFLQDCGSTHGTFISGQRLQPQEAHALNDWDVVTFGSKVTSGVETYPPREFSVGFEWTIPTFDSSVTLPKPLISTGFQVPDEDNDSSSEVSIAESLQIVDSHPRTYSVPSSEDEDSMDEEDVVQAFDCKPVPDMSKEISDISKLETAQTTSHNESTSPGSGLCAASKNDSLSVETKSAGASQANPIDLEHAQSRQPCIDLDSDSDDEGPEVLTVRPNPTPDKSSSSKLDYRRRDDWDIQMPSSISVSNFTDPIDAEAWQSDNDGGSPGLSGTENTESSIKYPSTPSGDLKGPLERHVSFNFDTPLMECPQVQTNQIPARIDTSRNPNDDDQIGDSVVRFTCLDRAPSPSDAALAKKPSVSEADYDEYLPPLLHEDHVAFDRLAKRASQLCKNYSLDNTRDSTSSGFQQLREYRERLLEGRRNDELHKDKDELRKTEATGAEAHDWNTVRPNTHSAFSDNPPTAADTFDKFHNQFADSKYLSGPFSVRECGLDNFDSTFYPPTPRRLDPNVPSISRYPGDYSNAFKYAGYQPAYSREFGPSFAHGVDVHPSSRADHPSTVQPGLQKRSRLGSSNISNSPYPTVAAIKPVWAHKHAASEIDESQPPRLPISDLLTPHPVSRVISDKIVEPELLSPPMSPQGLLPGSKGTKRKADEFDADTLSNDSQILQSQWPVLPDAQPRVPTVPAETSITQTSQDSFVLEGQGSSQAQLKALAARETGPPRKKARTQSSITGDIAKVVSGITLGAVGVFAYLVATIPDSVREEAIREVSRLA